LNLHTDSSNDSWETSRNATIFSDFLGHLSQ
jgi:hypothetical protein